MEFLLLIEDRRGEAPRAPVGVEEMGKFARELGEAGVLRGAAGPLRPESQGARVFVAEGKALITDGPFATSREVVGGYFLVDVPDRAAAIEVAKRCPYARAGVIEVRAARYNKGADASGAPQFLLLYLVEPRNVPPDRAVIERGMREMSAVCERLRRDGVELGDGSLPPDPPAAMVESHENQVVVRDGPFAETKEVVAGFSLIQARDRAEAIEVAARIPHAAWGGVEVREVGR